MMKHSKIFKAVVLTAALLAFFIPTRVWAQYSDRLDFTVDGIAYRFLADGTVGVVPIERLSHSNYEEFDNADLVIPGYVTYHGQQYRVSRIDARSFLQDSERFGLYRDGTESLGPAKVTIPATVDVVESGAFSANFYGELKSNLRTVVIEGPNTLIQSGAFSGNPNLTEVIAPNTVSPMGFNGTPWYDFWYDYQPDGVLYYGTEAVGYKGGQPVDSAVVLRPGTTAIGKYCFRNCKWLKSIDIPSTVTVIDVEAFYNCSNLQSVNIPSSVTTIGDYAFRGCSNLQSINIPELVTTIGDYAFYNCSKLQDITNIENVPNLGNYALGGTAWLNQQDDGLVYLGSAAYCYKGTFYGNSISLKEGTTTIAAGCFNRASSLTTVVLPSTLKKIGDYAFGNCSSLRNVSLPDGLEMIGSNAFNNCKALARIALPSSLSSLASDAFLNCVNLREVSCEPSNAHFASQDGVLFTKDMSTLLVYPNGHATTFDVPSTVTRIGDYAFYGCDELEAVAIPSGLTTIGYCAFCYCTSLKKVSIPASVGVMKSIAFYGCTSLEQVNFAQGSQLTSITCQSFQGCSRLRTINIPSSVEIIGLDAFYDCDSLRSIKLPIHLKKLGAYAFCNWNNYDKYRAANGEPFDVGGLQGELVIPSQVKYVGHHGFAYNYGLTSVKMEEGVKEIIWDAFLDCHSLKEVYLPSTISYIYYFAFSGCDSLQVVRCAAPDPTTMKTYIINSIFPSTIFDTCVLQVPKGSAELYKTAAPWSKFKHIEEFEDVLPGDVNGDGVVSGADVTALYNVLLDNAIVSGDADVNGDGVVSGADVTALYNILLN